MSLPIVIVASGGIPVTEVVSGLGTPVSIATNGFGLAATIVTSGGLPVVGAGGIALSNSSIAENSANGTTLGTASIINTVTGTPAWSITDALGVFQINSSTGVITVVSNTNLNYEVNQAIPFSISVSGVTPSVPTQNFSATVTNVIETPVNSVAPVITGTAAVGSLLSCSTGTWSDMAGPGAATYAYQWKSGGVNIGGATSATYTLLHAQAGALITCAVTATNTAGAGSAATSAATAAVTEIPSNTVASSISGSASVGSTLTAVDGTWLGAPTPTYTYRWLLNGVAISGATASTYAPVNGDIGGLISLTVTATNSTGSASSTSSSVGPATSGASTAGQPIGLLLALTKAA